MLQGRILKNRTVVTTLIVFSVIIGGIVAAMTGGIAVEFGGIEMTFAPYEDGRLHLSFIQVP